MREVAEYLGWKQPKAIEHKDEFLLARAMEHDAPSLLFRLGCEYLRSAKVIRPGVVGLLERVVAARTTAEAETHARVAHLLTGERAAGLDGLLVLDATLRSSRLHWLGTGPVQASPNSVGGEVEKLVFLRGLDAHTLDLSALPAERRRFLAQVGRRLTAQALVRREPNRRHPILLTLLAQSAVDVLDSVVRLFDQTLSSSESRAPGSSCATSSPSGPSSRRTGSRCWTRSCRSWPMPGSRTRRWARCCGGRSACPG
ncbi:DUF4158 domain-containing protein [Streptomyces spectabilis]|uniref:DUF4158 domain-containing protein n=1 Tax=Streptomyces spectabilis TaxID=68270 RepID=UPI0033C041C3